MDYFEIDCKFDKKNFNDEILAALLGEIDFESFVDNDEGFVAYVNEEAFDVKKLEEVLKGIDFEVVYSVQKIKDRNWNAEWESNYPAVEIGNKIRVRAPFHVKNSDFEYEIEILPQMSFGTAHHETTYMMLEYIYQIDVKGLDVLDMGCGTGVLGIFSIIRGAKHVDAIDIDEWAYKNSFENMERNSIENDRMEVLMGGKEFLNGKQYDVIIANINRNILLDQIKDYSGCLKDGGILIMSGFYETDLECISSECLKYGLNFNSNKIRNNWTSAEFIK